MDDVIIKTTNILQEIIFVTTIYFTVVLCVCIIVCYHFYLKQWFTNLFSFHFETNNSNMLVYAHLCSPNDDDRKQQSSQLLGPYLL